MRTRALGALATLLVLVGSVAGCGSGTDYANADRPPAPISISIAVTPGRVAVSPDHVGGGPVVLLIANESARSQNVRLTAARRGGRSCVSGDASSGPINPQGAARISLSVVEGVCAVSVGDAAIAPAHLTVGAQRKSAQQDLLQP
ncbi:MAG: hypothetical protein ACTHOE_05325 [Conexibacter sp.]